jgi:hypothetical protein
LWDSGPLGSFMLETTRLPPRERPYNLNVELARFRLMKIVQKQEDWNLFDFPKSEGFQEQFRQAQGLFSDALGKLEEPAEAARLADESLARSVELSEQLSQLHCGLLLKRPRAVLETVAVQSTIPLLAMTVGQQYVTSALAGILIATVFPPGETIGRLSAAV